MGTAMPERTGKKQDGRFMKGASGNPAGRPKGSRNKATIAAQSLLENEAGALTRRCVELALDGDMAAMKLCLSRLLPPKKENPVKFALPENPADISAMTWAILQAVAAGDIEPAQASAIGQLVAAHCRAIELTEIEKRIEALERKIEHGSNQPASGRS